MSKGKVYFIGAGPGDPELITLKGLKALAKADVVIYAGSLVNPEILRYTKKGCKIFDSSKMDLEEIVNIMVSSAKEGKIIARLKTGDPTIFGALMEEIAMLEEAGVDYEIIPGVTAMTAAASVAKTSLTIPETNQAILIIRYSKNTPINIDIEDLLKHANKGVTVAVYLGGSNIHDIVDKLITAGFNKSTPALIVYKATWRDQKIIRGTLGDIAEKAKNEGIDRDYIMIIGLPNNKKQPTRSKVYSKSRDL